MGKSAKDEDLTKRVDKMENKYEALEKKHEELEKGFEKQKMVQYLCTYIHQSLPLYIITLTFHKNRDSIF